MSTSYDIIASIRGDEEKGILTHEEANKLVNTEIYFLVHGEYPEDSEERS